MRGRALLAVLVLSGCASPEPLTEIFLLVDTDLASRSDPDPAVEIRLIRLELQVPGEVQPRTGYTAILNEGYRDHVEPPVSWGIYASTDPDRELLVTARGYARGAPGELPVVQQQARVRFVPAEVRVLCLDLREACVPVVCGDPAQTCHVDASGAAGCVPIDVDEDRLPSYDAADVHCPPDWPG